MEIKGNGSYSTQKVLFYKMAFILFLILLLLVPNQMVQDLVRERERNQYEVQNEIAANWGPAQKVTGPVLSIPYTTKEKEGNNEVLTDQVLHVFPEVMDIKVGVSSEERQKSIYKTVLYNAKYHLNASFNLPETKEFGKNVVNIDWDKVSIDIGFTSAASLDNQVSILVDSESFPMKSGSSTSDLFRSGIHTNNIKIDPTKRSINTETTFGLNGSRGIKFTPIASNSTINMSSDWSSPGFVGIPLPQNREITNTGFSATWKATEYNRPHKAIWNNGEISADNMGGDFGVDLIQTVGHYQKNMRSAKYASLIIGLTFLIFFFFESLKGSKIHPVQYILVGVALTLFYILLLSISEHLGFGNAYLIASIATIGLISWYGSTVLKNRNRAGMLLLILSGLYGYIYSLLQMEDYALLVGSIGLFAITAFVMYISRNMDWYNFGEKNTPTHQE